MPSNNYCAYRECYSKSGMGISLFAFPKDRKRAEMWIHACNRSELLQKKVDVLHNYHKLCEKHFEDKYLSKGDTRKTLIGDAVPTLFQNSSRITEGSVIGSPCKIMAVAGNLLFIDPCQPRLSPTTTPSTSGPTLQYILYSEPSTSTYTPGRPGNKPNHPDYVPSVHMDDDMFNVKESNVERETLSKIKCCIPECSSKEEGANFYNFPKNLLLVNMWKSALKILRSQVVAKFLVCEQHFDERDFISGTKTLKKMAIPSIQRNDKKQKQSPALEKITGHCTCKCTCQQRQNDPKSTTLDIIQIIHNYSKSYEASPTTAQSIPNQNNGDDYSSITSKNKFSIDRLNQFEKNEIKESSIVICDKSARVVINTDNTSLGQKLARQVKMVLAENNVSPVPDNVAENLSTTLTEFKEEKISDLAPNLKESNDKEEVICLSDSEERTAVITKESKPNLLSELTVEERTKLQKKVALINKYKEMTKKFGTKCPYCGFSDADVLLSHIRRIHYGMFSDQPLSDETIYKDLIRRMETLEKEEEEFPTLYLNAHYKISCQYCGEFFPSIIALTIHVKDIHEPTCGPLPLSEDQLKNGMKNCKFCNRILNTPEDYTLHVNRCISNPFSKVYKESHVCEFCGEFGTRDQIKSHKARNHRGEDKSVFICEICGRTLSNAFCYRNHLLRHENKRGIRCRVKGCNKFFNTPACLQKHNMTHLPSESWKCVCNTCGKRFLHKLTLLKHQDTHSMVRSTCGHCGQTFKGKFSLRLHVSTKHGKGNSWNGKRVAVPREKVERGMGRIGDNGRRKMIRANSNRIRVLKEVTISQVKRSKELRYSESDDNYIVNMQEGMLREEENNGDSSEDMRDFSEDGKK